MKKRWIALLALFVVALALSAYAPGKQTDVQFVVVQQDQPVFNGPGSGYEVVGQANSGQALRVLSASQDDGWWQVVCAEYPARTCWLNADPQATQPVAPPGGFFGLPWS